jgi:hypothetical protein
MTFVALFAMSVLTQQDSDQRYQETKIEGISFIAQTAKKEYKAGESIVLDVRVQNESEERFLLIDSKFQRTWNMIVDVYDGNGNHVEYPGWNMTTRVMQPRSASDFVVVPPSRYFGDPSAYEFYLSETGNYSINVSLYGGAYDETAKKLKLQNYIPGMLRAHPIKISVTG